MDKELKILIIEDVPSDAEAIENELRREHIPFHAQRLDTREAFLEALRNSPPDIVLSDFTLPNFNALEALHLLQEHHCDIPFVLVTGSRSEEVAVECIKEGADDYILKASLRRLPSSVLNVLKKREAEREKAKTEVALRRGEEQFRLITENSHDLISLLDLEGRFIYASPSYRKSLGYAPEDLAGTDSFELIHPEDQPNVRKAWREALLNREERVVEFRARHQNGVWRIFEAAGNWIFDEQNNPQRTVVVSRDITRRKQAEEALRGLPRLIRQAQEVERRRVARELHDSVNQILASVKFRIQSMEEKLPQRDQKVSQETLKAKVLLEKAMQEVRRISHNLRPSELDDLGLAPALRSLCHEFGERTAMNVELSLSRVPKNLPAEVELNLYRIIQEALNNIAKHSQATRVELRLARNGSAIRASIRDNGRGFDTQFVRTKKSKKAGIGLVDMRERAAFAGGAFTIKSAPGTGTELEIEVPFHAHGRPGRPVKATSEKGPEN